MRPDAPREFRRARRVVELYRRERRTAVREVHVGVVEARQQRLAAGVDHAGPGPAPAAHRAVGAHRNDAAVEHRDGRGLGARPIDRPDPGVLDDQVGGGCGRPLRGRGRASGREPGHEQPERRGRCHSRHFGGLRPIAAYSCAGS